MRSIHTITVRDANTPHRRTIMDEPRIKEKSRSRTKPKSSSRGRAKRLLRVLRTCHREVVRVGRGSGRQETGIDVSVERRRVGLRCGKRPIVVNHRALAGRSLQLATRGRRHIIKVRRTR